MSVLPSSMVVSVEDFRLFCNHWFGARAPRLMDVRVSRDPDHEPGPLVLSALPREGTLVFHDGWVLPGQHSFRGEHLLRALSGFLSALPSRG